MNLRDLLRAPLLLALSVLCACGGGGGGATNTTSSPAVPAATAPSPPTSVTVTAGDGAATIGFAAPSGDGGAAISGYAATCTAGSTNRTASGAGSPLTVTGLTNGTTWSCTVVATNIIGPSSASTAVSVTPLAISSATDFPGNIVLGVPTGDSIRLKLYSADQSGTVIVSYRADGETTDRQTAPAALAKATVLDLELTGLKAASTYRYRIVFKPAGGNDIQSRDYRFQTARPPGSSFTFTIQADSHLDENSDLEVYRRTLANALADQADFHVDLGDTFMTEKHAEPLTAVVAQPSSKATLDARYVYERTHFGLLTHSSPLFLVNGNHDAELGWLLDGTAQNLAVWAAKARLEYFPIPQPGRFYSGDSFVDANAGNRVAWYAWYWGDAQIIVLDPFWNTTRKNNTDAWNFTLGEKQYQWLAETLAASTAKFKVVFIHNLVGGLDGAMRGGIEAAPYYEWGGRNADGTSGFAQRRPGWAMPIHDLLVKYKVAAVFHGHDHLYAKQELDGIVYQTVPQPSAKNSNSGPTLAKDYHYDSGTILSSSGHLRITVTPTSLTSRYVRAWLPKDENATRKNGQIEHEWTVTR